MMRLVPWLLLVGLIPVARGEERIPYLPFDADPFRVPYEVAGSNTLIDLLDGAREAVAEKDWPRLAYLYAEMQTLQDNGPDYRYAMAQMAFWQNRWAEALRHAETLPPDHADGAVQLLRGAALLQLRRPDEAIASFEAHRTLYPGSLMTLHWMALAEVARHRYEEAAVIFQQILALDPGALDEDLALKHALAGDPADGPERVAHRLEIFMKARMMEAVLPPLQAATVSFLLGNREHALVLLEAALAEQPEDPELHSRYGLFLDAMGDKAGARRHLDRASELRPDDPELLNNRGALAMYLGDYRQASASFWAALQLRPAYPEALRNLSRLYVDMKQWDQAVYAARESLVVDPGAVNARLVAAFGSYKQGLYTDALKYLDPLLANDTEVALAWFMAASSSQLLGRMPQAERYYRTGLRLKGDSVFGLNNLADILLKDPDADILVLGEALSLAEKASSLSRRGNPAVEETLQKARQRMSEADPAAPE